MKFIAASTSCLCFTLLFENRADLASVPLIVSCVDVFTAETLPARSWSIVTLLLLEHMEFLSVTPLKVGLQVRGVAGVRDHSLAKSTIGLLLVCNHASIVCEKT